MARLLPGTRVSSKELAEILGTNVTEISKWKAQGMPTAVREKGDGPGGRWWTAQCIRWLVAQRVKAAGDKNPVAGPGGVHMRERNADGLTTLEQVKMENMKADTRLKDVRLAQMRGEVAPIEVIEDTLAKTGDQICAIFETIPVKIRRRNPKLTATDLEIVKRELTKALNIAASITPDLESVEIEAP